MTDTFFCVDPDGLDRLRSQLGAIETGMQDGGDVATWLDPLELGPNLDVWHALKEFHQNWSNGVTIIGHNIDQLVKLLSNAAVAYRGADNQIVQASTPEPGHG